MVNKETKWLGLTFSGRVLLSLHKALGSAKNKEKKRAKRKETKLTRLKNLLKNIVSLGKYKLSKLN
jgi:hypothetical protein